MPDRRTQAARTEEQEVGFSIAVEIGVRPALLYGDRDRLRIREIPRSVHCDGAERVNAIGQLR